MKTQISVCHQIGQVGWRKNMTLLETNNTESFKNGSWINDRVFKCSIDIGRTSFLLLTIVINSLHSAIIHRLRKVNKSVSTQLLLLMGIHDTVLATYTLGKGYCLFHWLEMTFPCGFTLVYSLWYSVSLMRYVILATACYERFVAICRPFQYSGNRILNNVTLSMLGAFAFYYTIHTTLHSLQICQKSANQGLLELIRFIIQLVLVAACLVVIITTIVLVLRELRRMHQRREAAEPVADRVSIRATYLILATGAAFLCCLCPIFGTKLYLALNPGAPTKSQLGAEIVWNCYPVFNTVICVAMNKAYQREVRNICCCCSVLHTRRQKTRQVSVAPAKA